jgi:hypothetical protein
MKVLASSLAGLALSQGQDRWNGFDYDYGFGSAERNQISQSSVPNVAVGQGAGQDQGANAGGDLTDPGTLGALFNPYGSAPGYSANSPQVTFPTFLGNGMMCWHCDSDSVYNCFNSGQIQICGGQDYFCYFHERRKIGHYFNRREKYIDNHESVYTDLFLVRMNNEAWNLDGNHNANSLRNPQVNADGTYGDTKTIPHPMTDDLRPATDIHVMAGCQQPQACLRQQMQNQAINIGVAFYGTDLTRKKEIGTLHAPDANQDFTTYIHPTSRRNVKEGLCRLGKDWNYYSGKLWNYDDGGDYASGKQFDQATRSNDSTLHTITEVNADPITNTHPRDDLTTAEADGVFGNTGSATSTLLWGRGIYDASDLHGHQFWHERESWYNGMRPNGFPDQHYHGGKGTESVCHFCCNPASSDGMFCNRRLLDSAGAANPIYPFGTTANLNSLGMLFANGAGHWMKYDENADLYNGGTNPDQRNRFVDHDLQRADDPSLLILDTPMAGSYDTSSAWLSEHRYHGMFRNPETQVSQEFLDPYIA